jgi:hypothetical protein
VRRVHAEIECDISAAEHSESSVAEIQHQKWLDSAFLAKALAGID